jgi:hypothetical protein
MFLALFHRLRAFFTGSFPQASDLETVAERDFAQAAGSVVTVAGVCLWQDWAGRYRSFASRLEVRISADPDRIVFDTLPGPRGELAVFYEVEVLTPERLPEGVVECLIAGPCYGRRGATRPDWWAQLGKAGTAKSA